MDDREINLRRFCARCKHTAHWHRMRSDQGCDSCPCERFDEMDARAIRDAVEAHAAAAEAR